MRRTIILPALASILILGGFGLTNAFAGDAEITLKAQGQPFKEIREEIDNVETSTFNIDSFFDVFYEINLSPDSCVSEGDLPKVTDDLTPKCVPKSDFKVDSFFDVFFDVEARSADNEENLRTVQTEILSLQLNSHEPIPIFGDPDFDPVAIFGDPDFDAIFGDPDFSTIGSLQETDRTIQTEIVALQALHQESTSTTDYFLKIDGIPGESTDNEHKDWIIIESMSSPLSSSANSDRTRGDVILGDISVVKELDKSTPLLGEAITTGRNLGEVEINLVRTLADGSRATYYKYELTNVLVTSYNIGGSGGEDKLTENITMNFEEVKVTYTEFKQDGSANTVAATWKVPGTIP